MTTFHTQIDALRGEISGLIDEIAWTMDAPLPKEEAKLRLAACAKSLSEKFQIDLLRMTNPSAGARELEEMLTLHERVRIRSEGVGVEPLHIDMSGILFAVLGDDLIKRMGKQIDTLNYVAGQPTKEREASLAKLRDNLYALEMQEEQLICDAEAAGVYIARRVDANPEIVLSYDSAGQSNELRLPGRIAAGVFTPPAS